MNYSYKIHLLDLGRMVFSYILGKSITNEVLEKRKDKYYTYGLLTRSKLHIEWFTNKIDSLLIELED